MFVEYNANPYRVNIDDCLIRAITLGTGKDYMEVMDGLIDVADANGWEIDELRTAFKYLTSIGWICSELNDAFTVKQFAEQITEPRIVVVKGHATFTKDGNTYDTWNPNRYKVKYTFRKCNS